MARERDPEESQAMLEQALATAERHRLPLQRMYAATRMGGNAWLAEGDTAGLLAARAEALRLGSVNIVHTVDGILVLDGVLRGRYDTARTAAAECLAVVRRLRLAPRCATSSWRRPRWRRTSATVWRWRRRWPRSPSGTGPVRRRSRCASAWPAPSAR
ncbi:hypothetical protein O1M54_47850 [Streptomyces diastatochromogenes]|nr:hypothetical protein [Streptomyces diastatochromogenes]